MQHFYTYVLSLKENSYGFRAPISIDQPYEPIHIVWDNGFMDVVPPAVFEIEDMRTCLHKFRKLIRLSLISDLTKNTNTLSAWRKALNADFDFMLKVNNVITENHKILFDEIIDESKAADKHRGSKLRRLQKRNSIELKRLEARRKRAQKCLSILEESARKIKKEV